MSARPMVKHYGRSYAVLAQFPEQDTAAANAFMVANPNAALLCIQSGIAYLADINDRGVA